MNIAVAGIGYVGLSNAILLAQHNSVEIVDVLENRVEMVNNRKSPIVDKEAQEYLSKSELNIHATLDAEAAYSKAESIIIATPTNYDPEKNFFNTSLVEGVIEKVMEVNPKALIVIKSTVPVGFSKMACEKYGTKNIVFSPEFLREGKALYDNLYPSRIVVGVPEDNVDVKKRALTFVELLKQGALKDYIPVVCTGLTEAEAIKLFANTFLASRVSFFNELDTYAELKKLNAKEIIEGVCLDPRIGNFYNNPSFGYGGYCLPKDTKQMLANFHDVPNNLIKAIVESNRTRKDYVAQRIVEMKPQTVGIYKLAMKTGSDNFRQSSIQGVIERLKNRKVQMVIYEPMFLESEFMGIPVISEIEQFKNISDIIVANRYSDELEDVCEKIYTRDLFFRD